MIFIAFTYTSKYNLYTYSFANFSLEVVEASNSVWQDISCKLNSRISKGVLHVFVYKGYHGIKEKLGFPKIKSPDIELPINILLTDGYG